MYKDIEKKLIYHKENIINAFIKKGIYPNDSLIKFKLESIDERISIFNSPIIKEGSYFDTSHFNKCIKLIYNDLAILYKVLYEINKIEFNQLNQYSKMHINEMQNIADLYLEKSNLEAYSTTLGKTILFLNSNFDLDYKNNVQVINLGQLEIENASEILCIANINNIEYNNILFKFFDGGNTYTVNPYNYNNSTLIMPGNITRNIYEVNLQESQVINGMIELPVNLEILNNKYLTLGAKDKILYKKANENGEIIEEKPIAINALNFSGHCYIDFYTLNCTGITFRFNKKPIAANFNIDESKITDLDYIHHFFIECDDNFTFDFEIEKGQVFAIKERTLIENDSLYYSGNIKDIKDFVIIETLDGDISKYNTYIEINNSNIKNSDIKSIMIKKIR